MLDLRNQRARRRILFLFPMLALAIPLGACDSSATEPKPATATDVVITAPATTVERSKTLQLAAEVRPTGVPQSVAWSTSDPAVASVSASGLVTGVNDGPVTITATSTTNPLLSDAVQLTVTCGVLVPADVASGATLPPDTCYEAHSPLAVSSGTLAVGQGVKISFGPNAYLTIGSNGSLNAVGTSAKPINFTSINPGNRWRGIQFNGSRSTSNVLRYVTVASGGSTGWSGAAYSTSAVLLTSNSLVDIRNSTIVGSGGQGITVYGGADMTFEDNTLAENAVAAWVHANTAGFISGNTRFIANTHNVVRVAFANTDAVTDAQTWDALTVPYEIQDRVFIDARLTLEPGATLTFTSAASAIVRNAGALTADGTAAQPIRLAGVENLAGSWKGLQITTQSANNIFDHVFFENGGSQPWTGNTDSRAMVYMEGNSKAVFTNTTFRGSSHYGLWVPAGGDITGFDGNEFTGNGRALIVHPNRAGAVTTSTRVVENTENRIRVTFGNTDAVVTAQTWGHANTPFYVTNRTFIQAALTLAAGTTVEFAQNASLIVNSGGSLSANGAAEAGGAPVTLRGGEDLVGYWQGIEYGTASALNRMTNTFISNAGSQQWFGGANSTASMNITGNGALSLAGVTFARSGGYAAIVRSGGVLSCSAVDHGGFMYFDSAANAARGICP